MSTLPLTPRTQGAQNAVYLLSQTVSLQQKDLDKLTLLAASVWKGSLENEEAAMPVGVFQIPVGGEEALLLTSMKSTAEGSFKELYPGVLATSRKVEAVAMVRTKKLSRSQQAGNQQDFHDNEIGFLEKAVTRPVPGAIDVIAVKNLPGDPELRRQFIAVFPMYSTDLHQIFKDGNCLSRSTLRKIQEGIIEAMAAFHSWGIHRDVKPENFLLKFSPPPKYQGMSLTDPVVLNDPEIEIEIRLCDFAFARENGINIGEAKQPGSYTYMTPEYANFIRESKRTENTSGDSLFYASQKGDIWSTGLILLFLQDFNTFRIVSPIDNYERSMALNIEKLKEFYRGQEIPETVLKRAILHAEHEFAIRYRGYYKHNRIPYFEKPIEEKSMDHIIWEMLRPRPENRPSMEQVMKTLADLKASENDRSALR